MGSVPSSAKTTRFQALHLQSFPDRCSHLFDNDGKDDVTLASSPRQHRCNPAQLTAHHDSHLPLEHRTTTDNNPPPPPPQCGVPRRPPPSLMFAEPPLFSAYTLVLHPCIYMLHKYFVSSWKHQTSPHPHNFCFRGFTENNTHRRDGCILKVQ